MTRVLLADDSPHAQRMGERILREEGFDVLSVASGETAVVRLGEFDPDVILADAFLPGKSGVEICRYVKGNERLRHARVVLTAGLLETFDEDEGRAAGCDAILRKPFEASAVVATIKPLAETARLARGLFREEQAAEEAAQEAVRAASAAAGRGVAVPELDPERIRAAITLALDASLPAMIDEITERVLIALGH